ERDPCAAADGAHAVAELRALDAAHPADGPPAVRKEDRGAPTEHDGGATRLCPRALLHEQEFAALEVAPGLAQEARHLEGEGNVAVDVLVQTIVAAARVAEQERRGPGLAAGSALGAEGFVVRRIATGLAEGRVPAVRDRDQAGIGRAPDRGDHGGDGVTEVAILTVAEAVALHVDRLAEVAVQI